MQDMEQSSVLSLAEESDKPRPRRSCGEDLLCAWAQGEDLGQPVIREPVATSQVRVRARSIRRRRPPELHESSLLDLSRVESHKRLLESVCSPDLQVPPRSKGPLTRFFKTNALSTSDHLPLHRHHLLAPTPAYKHDALLVPQVRSLTQSPVSPIALRPERH